MNKQVKSGMRSNILPSFLPFFSVPTQMVRLDPTSLGYPVFHAKQTYNERVNLIINKYFTLQSGNTN